MVVSFLQVARVRCDVTHLSGRVFSPNVFLFTCRESSHAAPNLDKQGVFLVLVVSLNIPIFNIIFHNQPKEELLRSSPEPPDSLINTLC